MIANLLYSILTAGVWPAVVLTGYWVLRYRGATKDSAPTTPIAAFGVAIAVGMAVWSVPMILAGALGVFFPQAFGIFGWGISLVSLRHALREKNIPAWLTTRPDAEGVLLAALFVTAAVVYLAYPSESIYGGEDAGVYSNFGTYIAKHHGFHIDFPWDKPNEKGFFPLTASYPGFYPTDNGFAVHGGKLYPCWLALAFATAGPVGLFGFTGVLALTAMCVVYGVIRMYLKWPVALVCFFAYALNAGQIWAARITLTEMLAHLLLWSAFLLFCRAYRSGRWWDASWAGWLLGMSLAARLDALALAPLMIIGLMLLRVLDPDDHQERRFIWRATMTTALLGIGLSVLHYLLFSRNYFSDFPQPLQVAIGTAILAAAAMAPARWYQGFVTPWLTSRWFSIFLGCIVVAATVHAFWLRTETVVDPIASELRFAATFARENSFLNFSKYISPLMAWAGIAGMMVVGRNLLQRRGDGSLTLVFLCSALFTVYFFFFFGTEPFHFYSSRRFVAVVFPAFALFGGIAVERGLAYIPLFWRRAAFGTFAVGVAGYVVAGSSILLALRDDSGYRAQLESLANTLSKDTLIIADSPRGSQSWAIPLLISFDRPVTRVHCRWPAIARPVHQRIARYLRETGKPVYFLTEADTNLRGLRARLVAIRHLRRRFAERTAAPLPKRVSYDEKDIRVYKITGVDPTPDYLGVKLGATPVWGVPEVGFWAQEHGETGPFRWTRGVPTTLWVPVNPERKPCWIRVSLGETGAKGNALELRYNGVSFFEGRVPRGRWTKILRLPSVPDYTEGQLEIRSKFARWPHKWRSGAGLLDRMERINSDKPWEKRPDERFLGVQISGIELLEEADIGSIHVEGVDESGIHREEFSEGGPFRWTNGRLRMIVPVDAGAPPAALRVDLGPRPTATPVRIILNGRVLEDSTLDPWGVGGKWTRTWNIADIPLRARATLEINSDTFQPDNPGDTRSLGVAVQGIRFLVNPEYVTHAVKGVELVGFHDREFQGGLPFRWTMESAVLRIPMSKERRPKALLVNFGWRPIPKDVRVSFNGRVVLDERLPRGDPVFRRIAVGAAPLGNPAEIRIESNIHRSENPADQRRFGIMIRSLRLLTNASPKVEKEKTEKTK